VGNTPIGRVSDAAIEPKRRSARPPTALRIASAGVHLVWRACCDWIGAARSSRCCLDAIPHLTDRCRRRDLQSDFRAWLRSCRNRSIIEPSGLRVLFGKMMPDTLPIRNRSAESSNTYSPSATTRNFEIGSSHLEPAVSGAADFSGRPNSCSTRLATCRSVAKRLTLRARPRRCRATGHGS